MKGLILPFLLLLAASNLNAQSPRILDVFPTSVAADTAATIRVFITGILPGCSFTPGTGTCPPVVKIDGLPIPAVYGSSDDPNLLLVSLPAHAHGSVTLTVTDSVGHSASTQIYYLGTNPLDDYEQVLVPITSTNIPGLNGSRWITETWLENTTTQPADIRGPYFSPIGTPPIPISLHFSPGLSMTLPKPQTQQLTSSTIEGALIGVPRWLGRKAAFNSRVHDTSRQAQNWGTEIPVVREIEFADSMTLINVPGDARFRLLLRIYTRTSAADVHIKADVLSAIVPILDPPVFGPLFERVIHVDAPTGPFGVPGYVQVTIGTYGVPMQISVTSESGAANNVWAFVSITNNETQDVTLVTPR
jgi:hypothetical protein